MKSRLLSDEAGATSIEYILVLSLMCAVSIYITTNLIRVLLHAVAALTVNIAMYLTGGPGP
jgi:Flp pilus assembly pilin Flp